MEMALGFLVMLGCLLFGVHHGGIGLAVISGIGLVVYTFIFGYQPGVPPISVMLTILAVVTCAGFLQTSGGLTVMLKYAEKLLRNNPKQVTIPATLTGVICAGRDRAGVSVGVCHHRLLHVEARELAGGGDRHRRAHGAQRRR